MGRQERGQVDDGFPSTTRGAGATDETTAYQRATPRESMLLMATLRTAAEPAGFPLRVRNLSSGGLMAECDRRLAKDERVEVELRGIGAVGGIVAWIAGPRIGMRFDREIDPKATRKSVGTGIGTSKIVVAASGRRPGLR